MPRSGFEDPNDVPRRFYIDRVADRLVSEMLGLCRGLIADGVVNEAEARALRAWVRGHPDVGMQFPGSLIVARLEKAFTDGQIDIDERIDLEDLLTTIVGGPMEDDVHVPRPTEAIFDDPPPTLVFDGWEYAFTGTFAYGTRVACARAITDRGGRFSKSMSDSTRVLVVGTYASELWSVSAYGTKVLRAVELRDRGHPIFVVPEEHWTIALGDG